MTYETRLARSPLSGAFKLALSMGVVGVNPVAAVPRLRAPRSIPKHWTPEQAREFLDLMQGDRTYPVWAFLLGSGLRIGEVVWLRWANVDLTRRLVRVVDFASTLGHDLVQSSGKSREWARSRRRLRGDARLGSDPVHARARVRWPTQASLAEVPLSSSRSPTSPRSTTSWDMECPSTRTPNRGHLGTDLIGSSYALPGTLASRFMRCGKPNCRCKAEPPILHGPYLHWTRAVAGKTVTRTLTPEQAEHYQPWFDNARRLRELLTELETRSLKAFLEAED